MSTEVASLTRTPLRQVREVRELLMNDQARQQIAMVATDHLRPERLMRVTANAIRTTPKLQSCDPLSFLGALMQCASLGLEPNTILGHAYLVPFETKRQVNGKWIKTPEVQVIIGYKGLIDLARRSGHIASISANVVYDDDDLWEWEEGIDAKLRHRPGPQNGKKTYAYAIAKFREDRGGGFAHIVLPWAHIMRIRDQSQNWKSALQYDRTERSPWHTHEDAMAKKTAIRALAKYLPLSVEFRDAVAVDHDSGGQADYRGWAMDPSAGLTIDGEADPDGPVLGESSDADVPGPNALEQQNSTAPDQQRAAAPKQSAQEKRPADTKRPAAASAAKKETDNVQSNPARDDSAPADGSGKKVSPSAEAGEPAQAGDDASGAGSDDEQGTSEAADGVESAEGAEQSSGEPADGEGIPEEFQSLVARIVGDLKDASSNDEVEQMLELFDDQVQFAQAECPAAYDAIMAAADEARERTAVDVEPRDRGAPA